MLLSVSSIAPSSTNKGRKMKEFLFAVLVGFVCLSAFFLGCAFKVWDEKAALEIKILQHELAAYEAMEKELKE